MVTTDRGRYAFRPLLAAGFVAVWIVATGTAIAATGERGATSEAELLTRARPRRAGPPTPA